jgi:hypothetical protein
MKTFYGTILMITALVALNITSFAQSSCAGITTGAFTTTPNGANDYYGIYVTLDRVYDQDVTVNVNIYPEGRPYVNGTSVTVPAGELTVETAQNFAVPTGTAVFTEITNVSPSSVTANGVTYSTQGFAGGVWCVARTYRCRNISIFFKCRTIT